MNKYHQEILESIKKQAGKIGKNWENNYIGSASIYYSIPNPMKRQIVKAWIKNNKNISLPEFIKLLDSLYQGKSYEEKTMAGYLLWYLPKLRKQLEPKLLDSWLDNLVGWAEVDSTCQPNFTAAEILDNWNEWKKLIGKLSQDKNINKRRASLVLLTGVVSKSNDERLSDLAFSLVDKLKSEKDILITKAISWLLRDLTYLHRKEVENYLNKNENSLPKIAIRETKRKLLTGKK